MALLRSASSLPADSHERLAFSLCRSLAPSTLADYIRYMSVLEEYMGGPLHTWIGLSDDNLHGLVSALLAANVAGGTINSYISALGTFSTWLNKPRPRTELIGYLIRGEKANAGPMPKIRVHNFPITFVLSHLT